jgi:F-type H+-transporting ATPase subunit b
VRSGAFGFFLILLTLLTAASGAGASEGGLVLVPDARTLTLFILLFVVLILPVNALVFRPIFRVLDARQERISGTRRRAEETAREAEAVLERYEARMREVREDAEQERLAAVENARGENLAQTSAARAECEREISHARQELGGALAEARASLRSQAEELARHAAERVLGRPVP